MTAPQIGNIGVNADGRRGVDGKPHVAGFIVRDASPLAVELARRARRSTRTSRGTASSRIAGVDTRQLTRHLRDHGSQNGAIGTEPVDDARSTRAQGAPRHGRPRPREAASRRAKSYAFDRGRAERVGDDAAGADASRREHHVVAIDYGMKWNILRCLVDAGCKVTVVPAQHERGRRSSRSRRTASSSRTAPATRRRSATRSRRCAELARQEADLRHLPRPPAPRRSRSAARRTS